MIANKNISDPERIKLSMHFHGYRNMATSLISKSRLRYTEL